MAEDLEGSPQSEQDATTAAKTQSLAERVAQLNNDAQKEGAAPIEPGSPEEPAITDHIPIGRVMRPAGRMVMGSRALAPVPAMPDFVDEPQAVFSSSDGERRKGLSGGVTIMLVCAMAAAVTALFTTLVHKGSAHGDVKIAKTQDAPPAVPPAAPAATDTAQTAPDAAQSASPQSPERPPVRLAAVSTVDQLNAINDAARQRPVVEAAGAAGGGLTVENISSDHSAPVAMKIKLRQSETEEYSFLMFRGLPENFSFSAGFRLKDAWAVSLKDLGDLKLVPPADYQGRFKLEVLLVKGRNQPVENHVMTVSFARPTVAPPETSAVASVRSAPAQPAQNERVLTAAPPVAEPLRAPPETEQTQPSGLVEPPQMTISAQDEAEMMARAKRVLSDGDIASARLFLEHLARHGSGKGAFILAQTYDPAFLRSIAAIGGIKPEPEKAKKWYKVAAERGQDGARERLSALGR